MLVEPSFLATDERRYLCRGGWKIEVCRNTNQTSNCTFYGKKPPPTGQTIDSTKLEKTESEECSNDTGELISCPKEAQSPWKFLPRIPVRQVKDVVRDEAALNETQECSARIEGALSA
jgi:hypothetical protein